MAMNKVILMGRLTADPELKQTPSGVAVTSFSLAVDRRYAKEGEEKKTDFPVIVAFRQTAEFVCRYFKKGSQMLVCGELQTRVWQDQTGGNRYATEVVASEISFCGAKNEGAVNTGAATNRPTERNFEQTGIPTYAKQPTRTPSKGFESIGPDDDDLPF